MFQMSYLASYDGTKSVTFAKQCLLISSLQQKKKLFNNTGGLTPQIVLLKNASRDHSLQRNFGPKTFEHKIMTVNFDLKNKS